MASGFLSKSSVRRVQTTAFCTLFVLMVGFSLLELCSERRGPLGGTALDLSLTLSRVQTEVLEILHVIVIFAFAVAWLASSQLRRRHIWLGLPVLLLELFLIAMPK